MMIIAGFVFASLGATLNDHPTAASVWGLGAVVSYIDWRRR